MITEQDNALMRAWRRGELDEDTAVAFEQRLFLEPELLRAVEIDQALASGLRQPPPPASAVPASPPPEFAPARPQRRRRLPLPLQWALAAGLGAAVVWPWTAEWRAPPPSALSVEWVSLAARRGVNEQTVIRVAPSPGIEWVALDLQVGVEHPIDLAVVSLDGRVSALQVRGLQPRFGAVGVGFARHALAAGSYRLQLADSRNGAPLEGAPLIVDYQP